MVTDSGALSPLAPDNGLLGAGDGRVFALTDALESSRVEALDASDGKIAWKRKVPEQTVAGDVTVNRVGTGLVAVAGAGSEDYLLNAATGAVVSSLRVEPGGGQPQLCSPGGQPAVAVVGNGAISVLSTDPAGNRTIAIPPGKNVSVAVAGTVAYVRAEQANAPVYGYDLATGQRVWTVRDPRTQAESTLYAFDGGFAVLDGNAARYSTNPPGRATRLATKAGERRAHVAGRIRDEDIAVVRERSPIDEVVGEYLQLRNAGGGSLKGLCPFHDEKTPSFNVTPARGLWYCFSCAEGGDVIKFVQKIDNLRFTEAVERLAARAGIELRYEQGGHVPGQEQSQRRRLIEAHRAAAEFYAEQLGGAAAAPGARVPRRSGGSSWPMPSGSASATRPPSGRP